MHSSPLLFLPHRAKGRKLRPFTQIDLNTLRFPHRPRGHAGENAYFLKLSLSETERLNTRCSALESRLSAQK